MKSPLPSIVLLLAATTGAIADPDMAPFINHQILELNNKVDSDLASGALTQSDGDELKRAVKHIQDIENSEPSLTPRLRRDLREQLSAIQVDLRRKEAETKALPSATPSPSP